MTAKASLFGNQHPLDDQQIQSLSQNKAWLDFRLTGFFRNGQRSVERFGVLLGLDPDQQNGYFLELVSPSAERSLRLYRMEDRYLCPLTEDISGSDPLHEWNAVSVQLNAPTAELRVYLDEAADPVLSHALEGSLVGGLALYGEKGRFMARVQGIKSA